MPTIYQLPIQQPAMVGVFPNMKFAVFGDNAATITTAGYLNQVNLESNPISTTDILQVLYSYNPVTNVGTYGVFTVSISSSGVITLSSWSNPGDVLLPVVANHIAQFSGTTGTIYDGTAPAIHLGTIQAGQSGTQGSFISYPGTAANGYMSVSASNSPGDFTTIITNNAVGQNTVFSIPDPVDATAQMVVAPSALVNGNLVQASGTVGLVVDSGKSAATIPTFTAPTIANHLAVFTNTTGNLGENAATAINGGNLQAGLSGTAGTVASFPATAANGSLVLAAINAGGAFNTTISNSTMAQSTVYTIPDVTAATGQFLAKTAAFVNGNIIQASGTAGVTVDSGVATTNIQLKTQVIAGRTANIGGGGAGPLSVVVAGLTAASIVVASIQTSSNTVAVAKATATATGFDILFTGDPGAACTVNYVAYIAAQ